MRSLAFALLLVACGSKSPPPATTTTTTGPSNELSNIASPQAQNAPDGLSVERVEPASGNTEGGTYVRIIGAGFLAFGPRNAKVYFGSRQGSVVRFQSDTELIVEAPGGSEGRPVDILLIFDPGGERKLPNAFTFVERRP